MNKFKVTLRETYELQVEVEATDAAGAREIASLSYSEDVERRMAEALVNDRARIIDQKVTSCVPASGAGKAYNVDPTRKLRRGHLPKQKEA